MPLVASVCPLASTLALTVPLLLVSLREAEAAPASSEPRLVALVQLTPIRMPKHMAYGYAMCVQVQVVVCAISVSTAIVVLGRSCLTFSTC